MVDSRKLRARMYEKEVTAKTMADNLGMSRQAFYERMKKGIFNADEMYDIMKLLDIEDPRPIFFADKVAQ